MKFIIFVFYRILRYNEYSDEYIPKEDCTIFSGAVVTEYCKGIIFSVCRESTANKTATREAFSTFHFLDSIS